MAYMKNNYQVTWPCMYAKMKSSNMAVHACKIIQIDKVLCTHTSCAGRKKSEKLAVLFEEWNKCCENWTSSSFVVRMRERTTERTKGGRRWLTEADIAEKYSKGRTLEEAQTIAREIVASKDADPHQKSCIKPHPELPLRKDMRLFLVWDESYETTTTDSIVESLFEQKDTDDKKGKTGSSGHKRKMASSDSDDDSESSDSSSESDNHRKNKKKKAGKAKTKKTVKSKQASKKPPPPPPKKKDSSSSSSSSSDSSETKTVAPSAVAETPKGGAEAPLSAKALKKKQKAEKAAAKKAEREAKKEEKRVQNEAKKEATKALNAKKSAVKKARHMHAHITNYTLVWYYHTCMCTLYMLLRVMIKFKILIKMVCNEWCPYFLNTWTLPGDLFVGCMHCWCYAPWATSCKCVSWCGITKINRHKQSHIDQVS